MKKKGLKYHIITYGCQMNAHKSKKSREFWKILIYAANSKEDADFILFNTCCVRENAEQKRSAMWAGLKAQAIKLWDMLSRSLRLSGDAAGEGCKRN